MPIRFKKGKSRRIDGDREYNITTMVKGTGFIWIVVEFTDGDWQDCPFDRTYAWGNEFNIDTFLSEMTEFINGIDRGSVSSNLRLYFERMLEDTQILTARPGIKFLLGQAFCIQGWSKDCPPYWWNEKYQEILKEILEDL